MSLSVRQIVNAHEREERRVRDLRGRFLRNSHGERHPAEVYVGRIDGAIGKVWIVLLRDLPIWEAAAYGASWVDLEHAAALEPLDDVARSILKIQREYRYENGIIIPATGFELGARGTDKETPTSWDAALSRRWTKS